jgi:uncharacterized protein (DUF433 family)
MPFSNRLSVDPEIPLWEPVIRGTRISVELILELLAAGMSQTEILNNYPGIEPDDLLACLAYASQLAQEWKAFLFPPRNFEHDVIWIRTAAPGKATEHSTRVTFGPSYRFTPR